MGFLDILLEVKTGTSPKNKKQTKVIEIKAEKDDEDTTDYTQDDPKETPPDSEDEDTTDYTQEDSDESEDVDPDSEDEDNTDYTQDDDIVEPQTDDGDDNTDYTDDSSDDASTDTEAGDDINEEDSPTEEIDLTENNKNKIILTDFINLYNLTTNTINKLSNVDKTNIFINKILTQVLANLTLVKRHVYNFIVFKFSNNKYVNNLYQYNFFTEAFRVNIEMLKKISVFIPNS